MCGENLIMDEIAVLFEAKGMAGLSLEFMFCLSCIKSWRIEDLYSSGTYKFVVWEKNKWGLLY